LRSLILQWLSALFASLRWKFQMAYNFEWFIS
jgi:hypothetical protein